MISKNVLIDEDQDQWIRDNHISFSVWARHKLFEYIKTYGSEVNEKRSNKTIHK